MRVLTITIASALLCAGAAAAQSGTSAATAASSTPWRSIPTLPSDIDQGRKLLANLEDPNAKSAQKLCPGYTVINLRNCPGGLSARLLLAGANCNLYGTDIDQLSLQVSFGPKSRLNIRILPAEIPEGQESWYDTKEDYLRRTVNGVHFNPADSELDFQLNSSPFEFSVVRKSTGDVLFSTKGSKLVFENQFLEFRTELPEKYNLYGLGEVMHSIRLGNNYNRTIYSADVNDPLDENLYGSHPFYYEHRYATLKDGSKKGYAHGVYLRNLHGQDILLREKSLTWRTIGGMVDLTFYSGPSPADVIADYVKTVGLPAMQQYWTFGFHQCRWGYSNVSDLKGVVETYRSFNIPLETIWTDIDYMDQYRDWTNDPVTYDLEAFSAFLDKLHADGQHFVPIVDAAIYNPDGSLYIGAVWPGFTVFPDWSAPGTQDWWTDSFQQWYKEVEYDGIWLDMNEVSSFCVGSFTPGADVRAVNYPPYAIDHVHDGHDLAVHAVSPNATHSDGSLEYDMHSLWGHLETKATYESLLKVFPGKRPFIISRSSAPGTGAWAGHWGGDNASKWLYMALSIPQALSFSMFGIPMFGVDTCGFNGNTGMELCARWMQLSAFFPFYRNHNVLSAISQEAYRWAAVADASRTAMAIRYTLLPYMYTLFHHAHTTGATVMRALSWEFPNDESLVEVDRQFMLGPAIMVTPVLDQGANYTYATFPGGKNEKWYDWYTYEARSGSNGSLVNLTAPLGHIPVFVRGGNILALQHPAYTTAESRKNPWDVLVALDSEGDAYGDLYLDDGESLVQEKTVFITLEATNSLLNVSRKGQWISKETLSSVIILGVSKKPDQITFGKEKLDKWNWEEKSQVLKMTGLELVTKGGAWSNGWELSWK
ncbi:glycosyl hydrolases family 31-domain-containing protein [Tuber indicum]|nr:glycosyl hydrolases family 31-domain-containing protein [Tuber indicum]